LNYIDYIIIIFIVIGFLLGYKDGLVRKVIGLLGLLLAFLLAFNFSGFIGRIIQPFFNDELRLAEIVAGILIFIAVMIFAAVLKRIVHPLDKVNLLINQLLGGLAGALQMIYFISIFLVLAYILNIPSKQDRKESLSYEKIYMVLPVTLDLILGAKYEAKEFFIDYIQERDQFPFQDGTDSLDIDLIDSLNTRFEE
jgi:membrane protein required for colicin V production